ncbi:MAG: hypothetical protein J7J22_01385 [Candidatus Verstraetearchaeota archaeon]|nr:hypothetical protein [Candidatus Verstraetearchaeota archaeon]
MGCKLSGIRRSLAFQISIVAICAALYAIGSYLTAFIVSPWGRGQFRPAVVIPQVFAVVFGPFPAGIGAAIGTFIVDSIKHAQPYIPSLTAAVPSNFITFFLFGKLLEGKFSWRRFIISTFISLLVGNLICAYLYVPTIYLLGALPQSLDLTVLAIFALALTIWWFITMLPFSLTVTPILIRAFSLAFPSIVPEDVVYCSLKNELPTRTFTNVLLAFGVVLSIFGVLLVFSPLGYNVFYSLTVKLNPNFVWVTLQLISFLFLGSGTVLVILGIIARLIR